MANGTLNAEVGWNDMPDYVRLAFTRGTGEKVLLPAGFRMCKLSDFESLAPPGSTAASPWWSPLEPYRHDAGWEQRKRLASHFGVSIRELSRILVAVKENWNAMNFLLKVELTAPAHAFFGGVAGQDRLDTGQTSRRKGGEASSGSKRLVGSASQFYIPNLGTGQLRLSGVESLNAK